MKHRSLKYILVFTGILAISFVPFLSREKNESINQVLNLSATIISALAASVTLFIALAIFNKYGVDTTLMEKSSSRVFDLLEEIKGTRFAFNSEKLWFNVGMSDPFKYHKGIEAYYQEKLIFPQSFANSLQKIFAISSSAFMPAVIADHVNRLQFFVLSFDVQENMIHNYLKVFVMGDKETSETEFGRFDGQDMTVFQFLNILEDIKTEIEKWITENSATPIKLNL